MLTYDLMFAGVSPLSPLVRAMLSVCSELNLQTTELEPPITPGSHVVVFFECSTGTFPKGALLSGARERFDEWKIPVPAHARAAPFLIAINAAKHNSTDSFRRRIKDSLRTIFRKFEKQRKKADANVRYERNKQARQKKAA